MKTHRLHRPRCGFTLVELLAVISIIVVLAAMSFGAITMVIKRQKILATQSHVAALSQAFDQYFDAYYRLPNVGDQDELAADDQQATNC